MLAVPVVEEEEGKDEGTSVGRDEGVVGDMEGMSVGIVLGTVVGDDDGLVG